MVEDNCELIPQTEFPLESSADFTSDTANSELNEIFGDLAALPEADETYAAPAIEATEGMTDYVDIIIPANSTVDAGSEPAAPTAPEVHNASNTSDQSENQALVQPLESQAQTTAPQTLAETEYSGVIEDTPELIPQTEFPLESSADFTSDTANSELNEIFGDLAALPEADEAYAAPAIEATEGMIDYVDIIIPC